jgi:CrcB protein
MHEPTFAPAFHERRCLAKGCPMNVPSTSLASLYVALGGGAGAVARSHVGRLFSHLTGPNAAFPWGTLTINVTGSLFMGLLAGWLARHGSGGEHWRLLIGVGLLGGYTTFSTFSLELMLLIERGQPGLAALYAAASVIPGLAALWLGLVAMRALG